MLNRIIAKPPFHRRKLVIVTRSYAFCFNRTGAPEGAQQDLRSDPLPVPVSYGYYTVSQLNDVVSCYRQQQPTLKQQ